MKNLFRYKDGRWLFIWLGTMLFLLVWDLLFLNAPAQKLVATGFVNTVVVACAVVVFTMMLGWTTALLLTSLSKRKSRIPYMLITFFLNTIRSLPQIVGVLFGYIGITFLIQSGVVRSSILIYLVMAFCISLFMFQELVDLIRDRIDHFKKLDFYSAMRVCGISDRRVVNFDILWKNSRVHIFNKLISFFGYAVFLQCSVDFIISVGLSTDVNDSILPPTLGSMLATIDSKQDILAIGYTLTNPLYAPNLLFQHLQGITVAFLIVFTLMSIYNIANGYAERHRL